MNDVTMLRSDVENLQSILTTLHNKAIAEDLLVSYSKMGRRSTTSALTMEIEKTLEKLEAYLEAEEDVSEEPV